MTAGPSRRAALGRAGSAGASRAYPPLGRGVPLAPLWGEGGVSAPQFGGGTAAPA